MTPMMSDITAFHERFKIAYDGKPRFLPNDLFEFRLRFMQEELKEYTEAHETGLIELSGVSLFPDNPTHLVRKLEESFDALVDLAYVALGTAYLHGFPFDEGWRRVQHANMQKIRTPHPTARGGMHDVVKPKGWEPPTLTDLVKDHAHR